MNFKPIKYLKGFSNYEMSDVGLLIQNKKDGSIVTIDKTYSRAELKGDDGTSTKSFGLKTLYWKSWGKPLESSDPELSPTPKGKKASKDKKEKKSKKISLKAKKSELISSFALRDLQQTILKRKSNGNSPRGAIIYDGKTSECRILLSHPEESSKIILVSVETQAPSKEGYWFLDSETGSHLKFEKEVHKKGYGDNNIVWPIAI
jgi:hypothetical protein